MWLGEAAHHLFSFKVVGFSVTEEVKYRNACLSRVLKFVMIIYAKMENAFRETTIRIHGQTNIGYNSIIKDCSVISFLCLHDINKYKNR